MTQLHADRLNGIATVLSVILFSVLVLMGIACFATPIYLVGFQEASAEWFWMVLPSGIFFICSFGLTDYISTDINNE
jgi:hypothetical protein